jgi:hypothetical protein
MTRRKTNKANTVKKENTKVGGEFHEQEYIEEETAEYDEK